MEDESLEQRLPVEPLNEARTGVPLSAQAGEMDGQACSRARIGATMEPLKHVKLVCRRYEQMGSVSAAKSDRADA